MMKVLNLYSGIGGNRKLWEDCEVTAVESDVDIALAYSDLYPQDRVVVGDAHDYLLNNYSRFDFIWASPPCQSHGQYRYNVGVRAKGYKALYPDMTLYQEIIFLRYYFEGKWVVENVKPYYTPLVEPTTVLGRHLIWSNFDIPDAEFSVSNIRSKNKISDYTEFDISGTKIKNKRQVLRNCVDPEMGKYILDQIKKEENNEV